MRSSASGVPLAVAPDVGSGAPVVDGGSNPPSTGADSNSPTLAAGPGSVGRAAAATGPGSVGRVAAADAGSIPWRTGGSTATGVESADVPEKGVGESGVTA
jgi:hypothetical protein